jgi:hypothetical protein
MKTISTNANPSLTLDERIKLFTKRQQEEWTKFKEKFDQRRASCNRSGEYSAEELAELSTFNQRFSKQNATEVNALFNHAFPELRSEINTEKDDHLLYANGVDNCDPIIISDAENDDGDFSSVPGLNDVGNSNPIIISDDDGFSWLQYLEEELQLPSPNNFEAQLPPPNLNPTPDDNFPPLSPPKDSLWTPGTMQDNSIDSLWTPSDSLRTPDSFRTPSTMLDDSPAFGNPFDIDMSVTIPNLAQENEQLKKRNQFLEEQYLMVKTINDELTQKLAKVTKPRALPPTWLWNATSAKQPEKEQSDKDKGSTRKQKRSKVN